MMKQNDIILLYIIAGFLLAHEVNRDKWYECMGISTAKTMTELWYEYLNKLGFKKETNLADALYDYMKRQYKEPTNEETFQPKEKIQIVKNYKTVQIKKVPVEETLPNVSGNITESDKSCKPEKNHTGLRVQDYSRN